MDKVVYDLQINEQEAMEYGITRGDIVAQLQLMLRGVPVATFAKANSMDYTVRVWLPQKQIEDFSTILNTLIVTKKGKIPLNKVAQTSTNQRAKYHHKRWVKLHLRDLRKPRKRGNIAHYGKPRGAT